MEYLYLSWILLTLTSVSMADEEFIVYDGSYVSGLETNRTESSDTNSSVSCIREHLYDNMDIKTVLGKWKALELYLHMSKEGVNRYYTCPKVTIWEVDKFPTTTFGPSTENQLYHVQHINARFRQEFRHLRLLWDEAGNTIEYALYFKNDSAGYWQIFANQNGTLPNRRSYQQFSGTIQVLKAVNDHLVLNFCQEGVNGRSPLLFSVLFTREPGHMVIWELDSVHSMLQNKKLSIASRRMVCGNSAIRPLFSFVTSTIGLLLIYTVYSF